MTYENRKNNRYNKGSVSGIIIFAGIFAAVILIMALLYIFNPRALQDIAINASRVKNTFSYYILQGNPHFYYLEMEKNGKSIRVSANAALEVTYRDEFVVKSISSDDIMGKYITVKIEGLGKGANDLGVLMRGIDLVNKIMQKGALSQGGGIISDYYILINHGNDLLAKVPMRVVITPQDWLRFAKDSSNVKVQIEYLKRAISLNKEDVGVRKILAGIYARLGRLDEAIAQYKDILAIKSDDVVALRESAKCHIRKKEYDQAIELSRKLIKASPQDAEAYANLGFSLEKKGLWDQTITNYQQAVKLDSENYPVRFKLGDAYIYKKKINQAIEQYKYIAEHAQGKDKDSAKLALGDAYLKSRKYDDAIKYYKEVVKQQPRSAVPYANLASAYAGKGNAQEELENLQTAAALSPDEPIIRFNLGVAYEKRKLDADAVKEYEFLLKLKADDHDAIGRLADLYFRNKKYEQAVKYYEKLARIQPRNSNVFLNLGFAYGELKNYTLSAESYKKAISLGSKSANLHYNLAYTYGKLGREKEAIAEYEKVAPPTKEVLSILAQYYLKEKKSDQAIKYYKKMVALEPKQASSYGSLGYAYAVRGEWDNAIENYLTALKFDREDDELYANLAEAYEKKGLYQEALRAYTNAYELNPESTKAARSIPRLKILLLQKKGQKKEKE